MSGTAACKDRIGKEYAETLATLRKLWELNAKDPEASDTELGRFEEYGLGFYYVAPSGRRRGYFHYQICWGGSSEMRLAPSGAVTFQFSG